MNSRFLDIPSQTLPLVRIQYLVSCLSHPSFLHNNVNTVGRVARRQDSQRIRLVPKSNPENDPIPKRKKACDRPSPVFTKNNRGKYRGHADKAIGGREGAHSGWTCFLRADDKEDGCPSGVNTKPRRRSWLTSRDER